MPRRKQADEAECFRLYPNGGKAYFRVLVFKNLSALRRHAHHKIRKEHPTGKPGQFLAIFFPESYPLETPTGNLVGQVMFSRKGLTPGKVAHELSHALIEWCRVTGKNPLSDISIAQCDSHEEQFALALGRITDQFHRKCPFGDEEDE